jgi:hypothetical protein
MKVQLSVAMAVAVADAVDRGSSAQLLHAAHGGVQLGLHQLL